MSLPFMLPIRLGMVNADGAQELFVYALTCRGRVETTNYRTVRLPTGMELPTYLKNPTEFSAFYKAMFARQVDKQDGRAVFLEHAWDTKWCDPCAADPLTADELRRLGVFWDDGGQMPNVFMTRLHVRYDRAHFPEDLVFQETADRSNFQGRYVLRHPWTGDASCEAATTYRRSVAERRELEVQRLADLTGWTPPGDQEEDGARPRRPGAARRVVGKNLAIEIRHNGKGWLSFQRSLHEPIARRGSRARRALCLRGRRGLGSLCPRVPAGAVSCGRRTGSAWRRA